MTEVKNILLNNGHKIPQIGFGTFKMTEKDVLEKALLTAYETGYRLFDSAYFYKNEQIIGDVLKENNLLDKVMLATKIWPSDFGYDNTKKSIERSLKNFNRDYIDIMYLHWPGDKMLESYKVLEKYYNEGVLKNIAVCNFTQNHIKYLEENTDILPALNQIELHPLLPQKDLVKFLFDKGINIVAWSPLARADKSLLEDEKIIEIGKKYGKTPSQIILRFNIERGIIVIPKSKSEDRIKENFDILNFSLSKEDMDYLYSKESGFRTGPDPSNEEALKKLQYNK